VSHNRHGKERNFEAIGLLARVIQHEVCHLRGELINDNKLRIYL
jgi:peptide deformylase